MTPILAFTTPGHTSLGLLLAVVVLIYARRFAWNVPRKFALGFVGLSVLAHNAPDLDAVTYLAGYTHHDFWGHRGVFHSYTVGAIAGALLGSLAVWFGKLNPKRVWFRWLTVWFVAATWIHVTADMMCDCDEMVMWAWPVSNERLLFSLRPIPKFTFDLADGSVLRAFQVELSIILPFVVMCLAPLALHTLAWLPRRIFSRKSTVSPSPASALVS